MTIAIYSQKGGVGKTSIAFSLSKDLKLKYITNDKSASMYKMGNAKFSKTNIPYQENTIYDFGGFKSEEAIKIANQVDLVFIPTICDINAISKALDTCKTLNNKNIIIIATALERKKDYEQIKIVFDKYYPEIKVIPFRKNKLLKNSMEVGMGATEFFKKSKKSNLLYKNSFIDYEVIKNSCLIHNSSAL